MNQSIQTEPVVSEMTAFMSTIAQFAIDFGLEDDFLDLLEEEVRCYSPKSKQSEIILENAIGDTKYLIGENES